jgi:NADPH-dependent ferric siderophore reductase
MLIQLHLPLLLQGDTVTLIPGGGDGQLFYPRQASYTLTHADCPASPAVTFDARHGNTLSGSVTPALADVTIEIRDQVRVWSVELAAADGLLEWRSGGFCCHQQQWAV